MRHPEHRNNWIRGFRRDVVLIKSPDVRAVGFALCDAMAAWNGGEGPLPDVQLIRTALRQNSRVLEYAAAIAMGLVLEHHADPAATLAQVFRSVQAGPRAAVLCYMKWPRTIGREEEVAFMREALGDRSFLVRFNAMRTTARRRLIELVPVIEAMAEDADARIRKMQPMYVALTRDGYWVEWRDEEGVFLTVQHDKGATSLHVGDDLLGQHGIEQVAAMVRDAGGGPPPWEMEEEAVDG